MSCLNCGHENPPDSKFCGQCGAPLPETVTCASCSAENPPGLSFCRACGTGLSPAPAPPGEDDGEDSERTGPTRIGGGRYLVQRYLGEGGRKRVYLAHDTLLDRDVAVGVVKAGGLDEDARVRVTREAQSMARLGDHPHVVTVHDIGEEGGDPYIVSQYMAGGSLDDLLESATDRRLDLETILAIAEGITRALEYAHERGVVHRDLKPANVFLTEDRTAKLGDFGLAFSVQRSRVTQPGMIVGTVSYMAPEQALGHVPDARSDLYSLGALLYEMVTGRPPFVGDNVVSVISQHQRAEPVKPSWAAPEVPTDLEELIMHLLEKRPAERPSAAETRERLGRVRSLPADHLAARAQEDLNRMESLAEGVFVGREQEVERLRQALEETFDGRGRLMMLVGEPGIGKTRTAQELGTYARVRGARVLVGRSYEGEGAPAYWPWLQMARAYIHEADPDTLVADMGSGASDIAQVMSDLQDLIPGLSRSSSQSLEPEQARFRFFDSITTFLKNAAQREPLVLFLDDLHWADGPSLRLLQFMARELSGSRLLVIGTYRDVSLGRKHPLSQALADLSREGLVERVSLHGLTEQEVERFIEVTANIDPPRSLVRAVYGETEGNPFFVSEIVSLMASEGTLDDAGRLEGFTVTIPQGVREVVGRRLDRLSEDCNRVLAVASAVGREFGVEIVERVAELSRDRVLELLEEAEGQRIVSDASQPGALRFMFSHALVREALYEELGVTQRVRLHRRIAEAIEELCADDPEPHLSELAHHFLEAQELDRAIDYSAEAAKRAVSLMAYEEGADLYESALQALELKAPTADRRHGELLVKLAHAQSRAGEGHLAKDNYRRAALLARELDDHELFAEAAEGLSGWSEVGAIDHEAIGLIEEALALLGEHDSAVRARLLSRLAIAVYFVSDRREEFAREAVAMARRVGDPATLALVLNDAHFVLHGPSSGSDRIELASELIDVAEKAGDHELAVEGRGLRLMDLLEAGRIQEVDRELPIYDREAAELRQPNYKRYALIRLAMKELLGGRFENVERLLAKFSPETARHGLEPNTLQAFGVVNFALRRDQGRLDGTEDSFRRFVDQYPAVPGWRAGLAVLYMELDLEEDARREFEILAENDFAIIPEDANWVVSIALLSEVAAYLRDIPRATWLYDRLLPYAKRNIVVGGGWTCHGNAERFLGLLAHTLDRYEAADRHFRAARLANASIGAHPLVAVGRFEHARLLLDRAGPGDRERANALLGQALETAYDLGMRALVDRALALRVRMQGIESADVGSSIDAVASVVEEERPDLRGHTAPDGTVTILFSDIERSTELNERLGDRQFLELLREHNEIVRDQVRVHRGFEVKSQGDGFMIAFASPRDAVECSIAIQRALAARIDAGTSEPIRVRMGLHTGEAIRERDDFFGRNVVLAARIAAQARGGEILVSAPLKALAEGAGEVTFGDPRELGLKGLSGVHTVHPVEWEPATAAAAG